MTELRSASEVAEAIRATERSGQRTIVGIVGAPGAGKSTLADEVVALLGTSAIVLPMDGFHLPQAMLLALGRRARMGAPDTFDVGGLVAVLDDLTHSQNSGNPVFAPGFDRETEQPVPDAIEISPEFCTVVVEGNYLLLDAGGWERVAAYLDVTFALHIDPAVRIERLIARHEKYGKTADDARAWARGPDETNARLIETTLPRADYRVQL